MAKRDKHDITCRRTGKPIGKSRTGGACSCPSIAVCHTLPKPPPLKKVDAAPAHKVAFQDISDLLKKHAGDLDAMEMLAIASNLVGKLIAMQDQRKHTVPEIMELVGRNIEHGNVQAQEHLKNTTAGNA